MSNTTKSWTSGSLVRARGREWLVLPESSDSRLIVRPVGGLDEEVTGILPAIESVESATFELPDPEKFGDHNACRLLRDAARLSTRAAAGPFRSFGRIAVEPRPYQLVPLMLAMRLDPIRMLIADDVGIGKTIEAALIVRELLDRGESQRFAVLCPPHLAEQWQKELQEKFHLDAQLILTSTIQRLERGLPPNVSVFDRHRYVIVSTDFIKSPKRRDDFIRSCPELVIVDEAHSCTLGNIAGKGRQYRFELVKKLSEDDTRHIILVTATPHSGNEQAFRSLLSLLDAQFADLPQDLESKEREAIRRQLARHLVQRRRGDIRQYLEAETTFPERKDAELDYQLTDTYKSLFDKILNFAREMVEDKSGTKRHQRVRWWSALSLLRALASSPAAAAATLRKRADTAESADAEEADEMGRRAVLDQEDVEAAESLDFTPGSDASDLDQASSDDSKRIRSRLLGYAREADQLFGISDQKLQTIISPIKKLLKEGYHPILFCRFINTADYLARQLREVLKNVEVASITGSLPPAERENRIQELAKAKQYILVCTDCLSEGINLQDNFNAVIHYDLSWNPTRHEQREGRVDRFGQASPVVRVLTYWGRDNGVDGVVLDVLIRKHKKIKSDLGVSVAVPGSSEDVVEAIFEGLLLREQAGRGSQELLPGLDKYFVPQKEELHGLWDGAAQEETRSRSRFAQHTLQPDEVATELAAVREAIGTGPTAERFLKDALRLAKIPVLEKPKNVVEVGLNLEAPRSLRQAMGRDNAFVGRFDLPVSDNQLYLARTSPVVEGLASWVLDTALDEKGYKGVPIARRSGVIQTDAVSSRTSLLLLRYRYHLLLSARSSNPLLAEEICPLAFTGSMDQPKWLSDTDANQLLTAAPTGNLIDSLVKQQLEQLIANLADFSKTLNETAYNRAEALLAAHTRVRQASRVTGKISVEPVLPVDVLGCYVYLPED